MAITEISYTDIGNGEGGLSVRNKINSLGDDVSALSTETKTDTEANATAIGTLSNRVGVAEGALVGSALSVVSNGLAVQTLTPNVAERLMHMETVVVEAGTDIAYDILTSNVSINTAGVYRVYGTFNLSAPTNNIVELELYIDNLPTGLVVSNRGMGSEYPISFTNNFMYNFDVNDDITIYVKSTGTEVTISSSTLNIEKTGY